MATLLLVSAAVHVWLVVNTSVTARDSVGFARYALSLESPNAEREGPHRSVWQLLRDEKHPPGYPLAVLATSKLVRPLASDPLADEMLRSAQVASAAAAVLMVLPTFWFGRVLFGRWVGFASAGLLQLLPVLARDTSDGLSDGPFLLCAASALAVGTHVVRGGSAGWCLACGGLIGAAYLTRPEGLVLLPALLVTAIALFKKGVWTSRRAWACGWRLAVGFAVLAVPYMLAIKGVTNKPAMGDSDAESVARCGPMFAMWIPKDASGANRLAWVVWACVSEWLKVGHYGVAVVAVLGFVALFRRVLSDPLLWLPVAYACVHIAVLIILGVRKGYVSERHLLPVALVGVPFAVGGLAPWFALWGRLPVLGTASRWAGWPVVVTVGLALSCLPPLLKPLHETRVAHKRAGLLLADELAKLTPEQMKHVAVIDHYEWALFYSGRAMYRVLPDPPGEQQRVVYAVLELKNGEPEVSNVYGERHQAAINVFKDTAHTTEWLYQWPENETDRKKVRMVLIKQIRK